MKKLQSYFLLITVMALLWTAAGCDKSDNGDGNGTRKPVVVCTTFPVYDFARAVTRNVPVDLVLLIKPGQEVHSYEPSPRDLITIQNADLFLCVGGESDVWVDTLMKGKEFQKVPVVRLMDDTMQLLEEPDALEGEDDGAHIDEADEHIWTNPANAIQMVSIIARNVLETGSWDAETREVITENLAEYISRIREAEEELHSVVAAARDPFIVMADRFPLVYMADYYGIGYAAAFNGCSSAVEASSATISRLITLVQEKQLPCVYYIELSNHKIADVVAEEAGVETRMLHSVQNVTKDEFEKGATWVSLMKQNCDVLRYGLK
ncbi:MAG: metal ABC transporter substrate-binding protein [Treponemataceae bacterium]|nr:metal ABC transporter substrate-binding protein [Treponemataceae bacterium]